MPPYLHSILIEKTSNITHLHLGLTTLQITNQMVSCLENIGCMIVLIIRNNSLIQIFLRILRCHIERYDILMYVPDLDDVDTDVNDFCYTMVSLIHSFLKQGNWSFATLAVKHCEWLGNDSGIIITFGNDCI